MKNLNNIYRADMKTIIEVLISILLYISILVEIPIVSYCFSMIWIIVWSYSLYLKCKYKFTKPDYLLFSTNNDEFYSITFVIIGIIILISTIVPVLLSDVKLFDYRIITEIFVGLLILLNGIFYLPTVQLKIDEELFIISVLKNVILRSEVAEINIFKDKILVTNIHNKIYTAEYLKINKKTSEQISKYISDHKKNKELKIINHVA